MVLRALLFAMFVIAAMTLSSNARAEDGWTTANVNMRSCGSVRCPVILTIPSGARVWVDYCSSWCSVRYAGARGFVYRSYIAFSYSDYWGPAPPVYGPPVPSWWGWWGGRPGYRPPYHQRPPHYRPRPGYRLEPGARPSPRHVRPDGRRASPSVRPRPGYRLEPGARPSPRHVRPDGRRASPSVRPRPGYRPPLRGWELPETELHRGK